MLNWKIITLSTLATVFLVSCGPKKEEQTHQVPAQPEEKQMMPVQKPHEEKTLTPKEEEQLEINEDEVMNPFPG